ncbi:hypothetical protein [Methylobacterium sp. SyP6R]|nr:hypothetical protein [Methylobacterium sp. SyP6R]
MRDVTAAAAFDLAQAKVGRDAVPPALNQTILVVPSRAPDSACP